MDNIRRSLRTGDAPPRAPRIALREDAQLIDCDGGVIAVVLTDISKDGFRLEAGETLEAGEQVILRVARFGDFLAQIKWARSHEAGGIFLGPVPALD